MRTGCSGMWRESIHGVRPRLVRLVRDAVERCEVEYVPRSGGHDPVETARLHGVKQTIEVAKALRQRRTREGIGGRGARCVHHDRFSGAQPCICWIVELAIYCIPKQLTDSCRGTDIPRSSARGALDRFARPRCAIESAAAAAARCRNRLRRGSFILNLPLASHHSITSSAMASSGGGASRPNAFGTIRFTTRSSLVGCLT